MNPAASSPGACAGVQVNCPACGDTCWFAPSNAYRPFCSARCKGVDLGAWATEGYRVSQAPGTDELPEDRSS
jgi:endogenous inhibitor of DNA gyrase (YacG/DUF329 family)